MAAIEEEDYTFEYGRGNKPKTEFPSKSTSKVVIVRFNSAIPRAHVSEGFLSIRLDKQGFTLNHATVFFDVDDNIVALVLRVQDSNGVQPGLVFINLQLKFNWAVQQARDIIKVSRIKAGLPSGKTEWHAAYLNHIKTRHAAAIVGWKTFTVIDGQLLSDSTEIRDKGPLPRSIKTRALREVIETEIRNNNTDAITVLHSLDDKLIGGVTVETHYGDVIDHLSLAIASNASYETVQVLCDLVDVNTVSSWNKSTPMHKACYHHRYNVLQLLISRGATAVASTWAGWYPYHTAIMRYYQDTAPKYMHSDARATAKLAVQRYVHEQHAKGLCVNVAVAKRPRRHGGHYTDTMQQLTAQLLTEAITALTTATAGVSGACYAAAAAVAPSGAIDAAAAAANSADAAAYAAAAVASTNSELSDVTLQQLYTPVPDVLSQDDDASSAISYINDAGYESNTDILQDIFEHVYTVSHV